MATLAVDVLFAWRLEHKLFMMVPSLCRCCGTEGVQLLFDFGPQPPSNRFEQADIHQRETHPLIVGQCIACGLVQLINPMSPAMVKSRFEWLTYNEPESHLDDLVSRLCRLPGIGRDSRVIGLTYKDDSTLARFNRLGYVNTYRYQTAADLGLHDRCAGLESIQAALDESMAFKLAARRGRADLLIIRHVLEHVHDPELFLRAARTLVEPAGYLVFEMPDCRKFLEAGDQCFIWEEHIAYFTPATLLGHCARSGLADVEIIVYPYPLEDSLIGLVRNERKEPSTASADTEEIARAGRFRARALKRRAGWRAALARLGAQGRRVAVFGAGHLAAKFINFNEVADLIECVIDDNPNKQQLFMPGSRLPIVGSGVLASGGGVDLCLLSLSPESEQRVLEAKKDFCARGGEFRSIFALSPVAMRAEASRGSADAAT